MYAYFLLLSVYIAFLTFILISPYESMGKESNSIKILNKSPKLMKTLESVINNCIIK